MPSSIVCISQPNCPKESPGGNRAIFLDRDGVINSYVYNSEFGTVDSPSNPGEFQVIDGVPQAIRAFKSMGFLIIVVSNQPGIAKGKFTPEILDAVTAKMMRECSGIDDVFYCLHHPQSVNPRYLSDCACRKPKPGLLFEAIKTWNIDVSQSFMVGDGLTDVMAGRAAGVRTILLNSRKCYLCDEIDKRLAPPDYMVESLPRALDIVHSQFDRARQA